MLEIKSDKEVEVVFKYIHPSYAYQLIYFNEARDRMIE